MSLQCALYGTVLWLLLSPALYSLSSVCCGCHSGTAALVDFEAADLVAKAVDP